MEEAATHNLITDEDGRIVVEGIQQMGNTGRRVRGHRCQLQDRHSTTARLRLCKSLFSDQTPILNLCNDRMRLFNHNRDRSPNHNRNHSRKRNIHQTSNTDGPMSLRGRHNSKMEL